MAGYSRGVGGGGSGTDATARATAAANTADIATLNASQTAQDALIAASASQAQVDALQAVQDAEDPYTAFARQPDGSINWTRESGATGTIAASSVVAAKADQAALDAEIARAQAAELLRELVANKQTVVRAAGVADDTAYPSEKAVRDALDALNFAGVYKGSAADAPGLPAGANGDWAIVNVGTTDTAGIYVTDGTTYTLAKAIPDFLVLTQAQVTSTTGADYTAPGLVTTERLDQWALSRIIDQVVPQTTNFNWDTDGLPEGMVLVAKNVIASSVAFDKGSFDLVRNGVLIGTQDFTWFGGQTIVAQRRGNTIDLITFEDRGRKTFNTEATFAGNLLRHDEVLLAKDTNRLWYNKTDTAQTFDPTDLVNFGYWEAQSPDVVFPGDNGAIQVGKKNVYYADETVPDVTAVVGVQGDEFVIARASYNSGSDAATQAAGNMAESLYTRDADSWVITQGGGDGLRGNPVANNAALTALQAKDYERRKVLADGKEYVFELGAVAGTLADDAATGFWQEQIVDYNLVESVTDVTLVTPNTGWTPVGDFGLEVVASSGDLQFYIRRTNPDWQITHAQCSYRMVSGITNSADRSFSTLNFSLNTGRTIWLDSSLTLGDDGDREFLDFTATNNVSGQRRFFRLECTVTASYTNCPVRLIEYKVEGLATGTTFNGASELVNFDFDTGTNNDGAVPGSSSSGYWSADHNVTLSAGLCTANITVNQAAFALETGTRVGGQLEIRDAADVVLSTMDLGDFTFDPVRPTTHSISKTFQFTTPAPGVYKLRFFTPGGAGSGNRRTDAGSVNAWFLTLG